jgi:cell wall-associated NlpC family hydrolase
MSLPDGFDARLTPARADLAAACLEGKVPAPRYVEARRHQVIAPVVRLHRRPDDATPPDTELLFGEEFDVYDIADGWAWGQSMQDGYVGYVPETCLRSGTILPNHRVQTLAASIYHQPSLKTPTHDALSFGSLVRVYDDDDDASDYAEISGLVHEGEWLARPQIRALYDPEPDWVGVAERFVGVPYIWGGRSGWGLDCSALVQLARQAAGHACPRDSDMQEAALGDTVPEGAPLGRGDLVFWKGHVGLMTDPETLLHANAHHMAVAYEPLAAAIARIDAAGDGQPTRYARLDAGAATP